MNETDPAGTTILVVDDDETICAFFEALLMREGFRVVTADNGKSALEKLKDKASRKIDLVLLDFMMPAMGGYEVMKELQQADYQNVPVFIVTARELDPNSLAMLRLESNVREFFRKPVDQAELRKRVHDALGTLPQPK